MSQNLNEMGLTAKQQKIFDEELAATQQPAEIEAHMRKYAKLAEENAVLARADQIRNARDEATGEDE